MSGAVLGIDGALGGFSAALYDPRDPAATRSARVPAGAALERGLGAIEDVLGGHSPAELAALAVGLGPGSFTGIRIALGYAKALALAWGRPLAGLTSYQALDSGEVPCPALAAVGTRAGFACARLRTAAGEFERCGRFAEVAQVVAERLPLGARLALFGAAEGVVAALGERGITVVSFPPDEVPALAIATAASAWAAGSLHAPRPHYGSGSYVEDPPLGRPYETGQ